MNKKLTKLIMDKFELTDVTDVKITEKVRVAPKVKGRDDEYEFVLVVKFKKPGSNIENIKFQLEFQSLESLMLWVLE